MKFYTAVKLAVNYDPDSVSSAVDNRRAYLLLVVTTWCWGCNAILSKMAVGEISPIMLVTLRWLGAVILLLVFARRYLVQDWLVLRRNLGYVFFMGAVGFTGFNTLFYFAAHTTSAVNIGIIQGAIPVLIILTNYFFLNIKIRLIQVIGIIVTLVGVCVVTSTGDLRQLSKLSVTQGDFLMLLACIFYAIYSVSLTRRPAVSALGLFTLIACAALIFSLPMMVFETFTSGLQLPTPTGWVITIVVILLPSLLAQVLFIRSVALIGPGRAGVFINLVPIFASLMAILLLDEPFYIFHTVALVLVLSGIALSEMNK